MRRLLCRFILVNAQRIVGDHLFLHPVERPTPAQGEDGVSGSTPRKLGYGSSSFGNDKKTAPFFSTGIGWNAHNEKFVQNLKHINLLRIRATYGEVGSVNFAPYQAKNIYNFTTSSRYDGNIGVILQGFGNEQLKWQTTKSTELGLTLGLFNRFDLTASWYRRLTTDMVLPVTTPPSMGFTSITQNLGKMENRGCIFSFMDVICKLSTVAPFIFHWPELSHKILPRCEGSWGTLFYTEWLCD